MSNIGPIRVAVFVDNGRPVEHEFHSGGLREVFSWSSVDNELNGGFGPLNLVKYVTLTFIVPRKSCLRQNPDVTVGQVFSALNMCRVTSWSLAIYYI